MKTLLLIPSYAKSGLESDIAADRHPTMDYDALAKTLRAVPGDQVDLLDYAAVDRDANPLVQAVRKLAGRDVALAVMGFLRRKEHDTLFTNAENVAMPLAMLLKTVARRPRHVTIGHRLSPRKKEVLFRWFKLHRQMDAIFVYASTQRDFARSVIGIPSEIVRLISFHADHRFYRPLPKAAVDENQNLRRRPRVARLPHAGRCRGGEDGPQGQARRRVALVQAHERGPEPHLACARRCASL
ncbi:MAG: hypothetical protein QM778_21910 [Myxococcales bacterium]